MTVKTELGGTMFYVYNVKDRREALALIELASKRMKSKKYSTKIEAWRYLDTAYTYYIKTTMNGTVQIDIKSF